MGRIGKIARLPRMVREELNQRLDDGEKGQSLVAWLNALPQVQAVVASEFGGKPVTEQNLSEWKKRGHQDWLDRQERLECVQNLREEAEELGEMAERGSVNRHMSDVLTAEVARALREVRQELTDAKERTRCLGQLTEMFARLRREESNATRVQMARERWEQEQAEAEEKRRNDVRTMPERAYWMYQTYISMYGQSVPTSSVLGGRAETGASAGFNPDKSKYIQVNPGKGESPKP